MNTSPSVITHLDPDDIFVFGSNLAGIHGAGAAYTARLKFGAKNGIGQGFTGQCYALPTKDHAIRVMPLEHIALCVDRFMRAAVGMPALRFLVTQVGCGLAGYTPTDIAPLFLAHTIPDNVWLPAEFWATCHK